MFKIFIYAIPIIIIYVLIVKKVKIKWKTFLEKGFKPNKNIFGIYCYCGKQGNGKTLSITEYCNDMIDSSVSKDVLFMNLKSYNKKDYNYIGNLNDLLKLRNKTDIVIVFDEIFTEISKLVKIDSQTAKDIMDFLSQMRKRRIILLTSCQEWRLLPLYFRLYCRYQINCRLIRIPFFKGILIKNIIDGDNIKWDDEQQDFVGELVENTISHTRLSVANSYDTYETISKVNLENSTSLDSVSESNSDVLKQEILTPPLFSEMHFFGDSTIENRKKNVLTDSLESEHTPNNYDYDFWGNDISRDDYLEMKEKMKGV